MHTTIKDFEDGVRNQAISYGYDEVTASKVAAQAVIDRLQPSEAGFAIAQTDDFVTSNTFTYEFQLTNFRVDQSMNSGVVIEAVLGSTSEDSTGQAFSEDILYEFAQQINDGAIGGFVDEHASFRATKDRLASDSVTDWVKAKVSNGALMITAKLRQGFEWVANRFDSVSLEAVVPKAKTLIQGSKKTFLGGGMLKGFVFTNNPKNKLHRIVDKFTN